MFEQLEKLEKCIQEIESLPKDLVRTEILETVSHQGVTFPIYSIELGTQNPEAPVLVVTGGIHGLEMIGADVAIACLEVFSKKLKWDDQFRQSLESSRLVFLPIMNPFGIYKGTRSNANGVDLMRNAPVDAEEKPPLILGGHRISSRLPYYRGPLDEPMQKESQALCKKIESLFGSHFILSIDLHSGFGMTDRLWYPLAKSKKPFPSIKEVQCFKNLYDQTYPQHTYIIEPQAKNYTAHGDLWDYLYEKHQKNHPSLFLPFTLEMGSWIWVKKNPIQLFSKRGVTNPIKKHRLQRVLRRHVHFLDFAQRAVSSYKNWVAPMSDQNLLTLTQKTLMS